MLRLTTLLTLAIAPALASTGRADTYGLPPAMTFPREWRAHDTKLAAESVHVARTRGEWAALWKQHDAAKPAPEVDFARFQVVALSAPPRKPRAIYRIELDDVDKPQTLIVRVADGGQLSQKPVSRTLEGARVHFVVTPRSALPVQFVLDQPIDGALFRNSSGVSTQELGKVAAAVVPLGDDAARFREQAEKLALRNLTRAEIKAAKRQLWPGAVGEEYPQLWSVIQVDRLPGAWRIVYDGIAIRVDVGDGSVSREE